MESIYPPNDLLAATRSGRDWPDRHGATPFGAIWHQRAYRRTLHLSVRPGDDGGRSGARGQSLIALVVPQETGKVQPATINPFIIGRTRVRPSRGEGRRASQRKRAVQRLAKTPFGGVIHGAWPGFLRPWAVASFVPLLALVCLFLAIP
jgi:hypothetical protein